MKHRHPLVSLLIVVPVAVALASCGGGGDSSADTGSTRAAHNAGSSPGRQAVDISDFKFVPATITVKSGARITIANRDTTTHTVTADNGSFDTGNIDPGASKAVTLNKGGRFAYHCSIHPFMHGVIVARPANGSS
jgi:plastocyanin